MVKIGSGGAVFAKEGVNDPDFILGRLPVAQANHFIQIFWALQRDPITGAGISCKKPTVHVPVTRRIL